jgi:hypothetical protein
VTVHHPGQETALLEVELGAGGEAVGAQVRHVVQPARRPFVGQHHHRGAVAERAEVLALAGRIGAMQVRHRRIDDGRAAGHLAADRAGSLEDQGVEARGRLSHAVGAAEAAAADADARRYRYLVGDSNATIGTHGRE